VTTRSAPSRAQPPEQLGLFAAPPREDQAQEGAARARRRIASTERGRHDNGLIDFDDACKGLHSLPGASATRSPSRTRAAPQRLRRLQVSAAIDRNAGQIRLKALVSSAFGKPATFRNWSLMGP
jgi:hypothetical protein